jgi:hypothetical protein
MHQLLPAQVGVAPVRDLGRALRQRWRPVRGKTRQTGLQRSPQPGPRGGDALTPILVFLFVVNLTPAASILPPLPLFL